MANGNFEDLNLDSILSELTGQSNQDGSYLMNQDSSLINDLIPKGYHEISRPAVTDNDYYVPWEIQ
jgi:hypothetical protein